MFKNKAADGSLNLCGKNIAQLRLQMKISQRELADRLQLEGVDLGKNAIQQIEHGRRFVTDIEVKALAKCLQATVDQLLS